MRKGWLLVGLIGLASCGPSEIGPSEIGPSEIGILVDNRSPRAVDVAYERQVNVEGSSVSATEGQFVRVPAGGVEIICAPGAEEWTLSVNGEIRFDSRRQRHDPEAHLSVNVYPDGLVEVIDGYKGGSLCPRPSS